LAETTPCLAILVVLVERTDAAQLAGQLNAGALQIAERLLIVLQCYTMMDVARRLLSVYYNDLQCDTQSIAPRKRRAAQQQQQQQ
jgi:hypothetical protein